MVTTIQSNTKDQALRSLNGLPPLSPTLNRLMATLSRDDASFAKICDLIEKDAVISGNVLALVNSALFGRRGEVNSVRHAVSLLGVTKLRNAALSMSITRMWNRIRSPEGWSMVAFNQHAIATGILADRLAPEANAVYAEGAFVAGLLHDMGKLLIAIGLPQAYAAIEKLRVKGSMTPLACETEILGFTHAELSGETLKAWNLPEPMQKAVRHHHNPALDGTPTRAVDGGRLLPLSYVIAAADQYVNHAGITSTGSPVAGTDPETALAHLHLGTKLEPILEQFHAEFENIRSFV